MLLDQPTRTRRRWRLALALTALLLLTLLVVLQVVAAKVGVRGPAASLVDGYLRQDPGAPAFYCALVLTLVLSPPRVRWPTLAVAVTIDVVLGVARLIADGTVHSVGNGAIIALTGLTVWALRRVRGSRRADMVLGLVCGWAFLAATTVGQVWLQITARSRPAVLDAYVATADHALGNPSWRVGELFALIGTPGRAPFLIVYAMLPVAAVLVAAVQLRHGWVRHNVVLTFIAVGVLGPMIYLLFPVVGPTYAFGSAGWPFAVTTGWPWQLPSFGAPRAVSFDTMTPRNCVPSLHTAWAVVLFLHTRSMAPWLRRLGAVWLVVTLLATLGFGYHYGFDLVVGAIFGVTVEAAVRSATNGWRRDRTALLAWGSLVFAALLGVIRYRAEVLAAHPVIGAAVVLAVLGSVCWGAGRVLGEPVTQHAGALPAASDSRGS